MRSKLDDIGGLDRSRDPGGQEIRRRRVEVLQAPVHVPGLHVDHDPEEPGVVRQVAVGREQQPIGARVFPGEADVIIAGVGHGQNGLGEYVAAALDRVRAGLQERRELQEDGPGDIIDW